MHKKLMMACMAIAAFAAFVVAPAAQAGVLTEGGVALATGTSVTAQSVGVTKFTGSPLSVECETAHLQGTVTANSSGTIAGEIPVGSAEFHNAGGTPCSSPAGGVTVNVTSKLCLHLPKGTDILTINGCGTASVVFDLVVGTTTCEYSATSVSGTVTTNATPATATVSEQPANLVKETPVHEFIKVCSSTGKLDMTFGLYTTGGTTGLTIS
jgi:hypothetical protein